MQIIPSIDLRRGKVVKLVGGVPDSEVFQSSSPVSLLEHWESQGARRIHVVDLDSAFGEPSSENWDALEVLLSSATAKIQVGGGIRNSEAVVKYLDMGADAVIVSTIIFKDRGIFEQLTASFPDKVAASIDYERDRVKVSGWREEGSSVPEKVAAECDALPLHSIIITDISREGRLKGVDSPRIRAVRKTVRHPLSVAGGISSADDIASLMECGVDGAILGRMLYDKRASLSELIKEFAKTGSRYEWS
ncbi:MAG: 1-(5-phosphoribosyl)-5-[(5-phosphoribosylamino)methylideneamino] imidazole-4-carboxamide isomerase [Thermoplasmata archaeon]|nr:1-(5-phosphoribosyl)-5-[(5-phosphoribosylamino)methylideneamino] imidazole-4-carboxamide isomerase [Candidatus Sysuiplasma jiujiangense]